MVDLVADYPGEILGNYDKSQQLSNGLLTEFMLMRRTYPLVVGIPLAHPLAHPGRRPYTALLVGALRFKLAGSDIQGT